MKRFLAALALLLMWETTMAATIEQSAINGSNSNVSSIDVTLGTTPIENNVLVAILMARGTAAWSLSGWTEVIGERHGGTQNHMWWKTAAASESTTVTATIDSGSDEVTMVVVELSGVDTFDVADVSGSTDSADTITTPSITPSGAGAVLAMVGTSWTSVTFDNTWTNSFSQQETRSGDVSASAAFLDQDPAAAIDTTEGLGSSVPNRSAMIAAFGTSAGASIPAILMQMGDM